MLCLLERLLHEEQLVAPCAALYYARCLAIDASNDFFPVGLEIVFEVNFKPSEDLRHEDFPLDFYFLTSLNLLLPSSPSLCAQPRNSSVSTLRVILFLVSSLLLLLFLLPLLFLELAQLLDEPHGLKSLEIALKPGPRQIFIDVFLLGEVDDIEVDVVHLAAVFLQMGWDLLLNQCFKLLSSPNPLRIQVLKEPPPLSVLMQVIREERGAFSLL